MISVSDPTLLSTSLIRGLEEHFIAFHTDAEGFITYTNNNFLKVSKWTPKRVLGKSIWQMFSPDEDDQKIADAVWNKVIKQQNFFGDVKMMTRDGHSYYVTLLALPILRSETTNESVLFLALDITSDVQLRKQLQQVAYLDYETGLMSRYKLETYMNEAIAKKDHFSCVYLRLDYHLHESTEEMADYEKEIIQKFANRLNRYFQDSPIARVGKNEFVVLTPFADWFIQGFLQFLEQQPIHVEQLSFHLTVSGGIARFPEDQQTFKQLLAAATEATNNVLRVGGNRIVSLSDDAHKRINRKAMIAQRLTEAIRKEELYVMFQPQYDVRSESINTYEALVRWDDPELGSITPDELIPIAEETGFIEELGTFVITEAAKLARQFQLEDLPYTVSINSSVREFLQSDMAQKVVSILQKEHCPANRIEIEITENFAFLAEEQLSITKQLLDLQQAGVTFTLDDFGTGYGSFRYLQTLPIKKVKIDQTFTQSLLTHPKTRKLVEGMIQLCHSLDLYVIVEGVENEQQAELLQLLGADSIQGYYVGTPIVKEEML